MTDFADRSISTSDFPHMQNLEAGCPPLLIVISYALPLSLAFSK
jgi:hypothetical protein